MRIPTDGEGALELHVDDARIGNSVLLSPVLTEMISVKVRRVEAFVVLPPAQLPFGPNESRAGAPVPLLEPIADLGLGVRMVSHREAAVEASVPFIGVEVEITSQTIQLRLHRADLRSLVALYYDNLAHSFYGPVDPVA